MKKKHKKPTGEMGGVRFGRSSGYVPIEFPTEKEDIERLMLRLTLSDDSIRDDHYGLTGDPRQNPEDDFDFTLPTSTGDHYLDLTEVAPLDGPHKDSPNKHVNGEMSDWIWGVIAGKTSKYGSGSSRPIHLLLYPTHFSLRVTSSVLDLVGYQAATEDHSFESIVYTSPDDATSAESVVVFPRAANAFDGFNVEKVRQGWVVIADMSQFEFDGDYSGEVRLHPTKPDEDEEDD